MRFNMLAWLRASAYEGIFTRKVRNLASFRDLAYRVGVYIVADQSVDKGHAESSVRWDFFFWFLSIALAGVVAFFIVLAVSLRVIAISRSKPVSRVDFLSAIAGIIASAIGLLVFGSTLIGWGVRLG